MKQYKENQVLRSYGTYHRVLTVSKLLHTEQQVTASRPLGQYIPNTTETVQKVHILSSTPNVQLINFAVNSRCYIVLKSTTTALCMHPRCYNAFFIAPASAVEESGQTSHDIVAFLTGSCLGHGNPHCN